MKKVIKLSEVFYLTGMLFTAIITFYAVFNHFDTKIDNFYVQDKYIEEQIVKDSTLHLYAYIVVIEGKEYTILNYPNRDSFKQIEVGKYYKFEINNYGGIWLFNEK